MKNYRILLDMDGVIADFFEAAMSMYGATLKHYEDIQPSKPWAYAVHEWVSKLIGRDEIVTYESMAAKIDDTPGFWRMISEYSWAHELVANLKATGLEITVCTSPSIHRKCSVEKLEWLADHFPELDRLMIGEHKHLMARPEHILIDDSDKNLHDFISEGGKIICFPQPWNRGHGISDSPDARIQYVKWALERILNEGH